MPPSSHTSDFDCESPRLSDASVSGSEGPASPHLRGLRWRVLLGVLLPCPNTVESLRRAAANGRRRYAELRRGLIVDPRSLEDVQKGENLKINNPLSQDPDSIWGRYFRNAELEKIIESDLTRLYPEHGSFFQSYGCQAMLKRVLLVWALVHPQYGYRQGMHEVLAPVVYVLHKDVTILSQVRERYQDLFEDRFDTSQEDIFSFCKDEIQGKLAVPTLLPYLALHVSRDNMFIGSKDWVRMVQLEDVSLLEADDFGFNLETMVLGSDGYGAEGELGALISRRFIEHDAYCMFDSLLRGQGGSVILADYFTSVTDGGTGLSPVLEASADIYHSLAAVDMSLYIHLVGLGVEPQFFALRWLRVLFGREFDLEKLLLLWDAILAASSASKETANPSGEQGRKSARGSFISKFAVSMILFLRSTLLASSNATACLQKLLNFPKNVDIRSLIENAKMLEMHSERLLKTTPLPPAKNPWLSEQSGRSHKSTSFWHSPSFQPQFFSPIRGLLQQNTGSVSPDLNRSSLPEFYWKERWMNSVLRKRSQSDSPTTDVASSGSDLPSVPRSISVPEEVLVSANPAVPTVVDSSDMVDASHSDVEERLTMHGDLLKGTSDKDSNVTNFVAEVANNKVCPRWEGCSTKVSNSVSTRLEGHVCIRALDLSSSTSRNEHGSSRPDGTVCLCSSCNEASQKDLQQSIRRHSNDELSILTNGDRIQDVHVEGSYTMKGVSKSSLDNYSRAKLHALGRSMIESIQVLESALSNISKEGGAHISCREITQNAPLDTEGRITAVTALTDLRNISKVLLQM